MKQRIGDGKRMKNYKINVRNNKSLGQVILQNIYYCEQLEQTRCGLRQNGDHQGRKKLKNSREIC